MRRHWSYLKYVIRHKWFVLVASRRVKCSLWRALVHDLSKFRSSEWFAYARTFYAPDGSKQYRPGAEFDRAWLLHQRRNPHHWQYWTLIEDNGDASPLLMPPEYVREMVADWMGAGRAITGKWEMREWYAKNRDKIRLYPSSRELVETLLEWTP